MYDLGSVVPLAITLKDASGAPADGGTVALAITLPDGTIANPSPTHPALGSYAYDYTAPQVGHYSVVWTITGANADSIVDVFDVQPAPGRYIISLAEARLACNFLASDTTQDAELRDYIAAATPVIEDIVGGPVIRKTCVDTFDGAEHDDLLLLRWRPVLSITSIVESGTTLAASAYRLLDHGFVRRTSTATDYTGRTWATGVDNIVVTYQAGYTAIDPNVNLATRELVRHWWQFGQQSPRSSALSAPADFTYSPGGFAIPNRVVELLGRKTTTIGFA